jgi:CheY-like chemotaxis protein/HPt (histidine-containing phosphotransfer) domain-containing protein
MIGQRLRILLVDDHETNRLLFRTLIERRGHACTLAEDGLAALDAVAAGSFDLVLMDCAMPRLDGWEATRRIRERERVAGGPRLPIIALTAHGMAGDRERCLAAGMDDHLVKPVAEVELAAAIARAVAGAPDRAPDPAPAPPAPAAAAPVGVLVADPLPRPAAAAVDVLVRLGYAAAAGPWDAERLAAAPAVLVAARDDGAAAADLVRGLGRARVRPLILVSVVGLRHPSALTAQAAAPDALVLRPLQGPLVARALTRRLPMPAPPAPGRRLGLTASPGPALALDTLRMVDQVQPGIAEAMLRAFLADLDQAEADLAAAGAGPDRPVITALAHRIRGGAGSLGAGPLAAAAARVETSPEGDPLPGIAAFAAAAADLRHAAAVLFAEPRPGD